jgi:hypothetical protein
MEMTVRTVKASTLRRTLEGRDRRLHRRVPWVTRVRGLTPSGQEFVATSIDVCAGGLLFSVPTPMRIGESLILYLDEIGRVEGSISRILPEEGYAVAFAVPVRKRDKIADQLTWLINRHRLNLEEDRIAERRISAGQIVAEFGDGLTAACTVVDMSIFGVALRTNGPRPLLGQMVKVGERSGACVRYIDGGFALDFRPPTDT